MPCSLPASVSIVDGAWKTTLRMGCFTIATVVSQLARGSWQECTSHLLLNSHKMRICCATRRQGKANSAQLYFGHFRKARLCQEAPIAPE
jgi:hypothetical protein